MLEFLNLPCSSTNKCHSNNPNNKVHTLRWTVTSILSRPLHFLSPFSRSCATVSVGDNRGDARKESSGGGSAIPLRLRRLIRRHEVEGSPNPRAEVYIGVVLGVCFLGGVIVLARMASRGIRVHPTPSRPFGVGCGAGEEPGPFGLRIWVSGVRAGGYRWRELCRVR